MSRQDPNPYKHYSYQPSSNQPGAGGSGVFGPGEFGSGQHWRDDVPSDPEERTLFEFKNWWVVIVLALAVAGAIGLIYMSMTDGPSGAETTEGREQSPTAEAEFPNFGAVDERISQAKEAGEEPAMYRPDDYDPSSGVQDPVPVSPRGMEAPSKSAFELTPLEAGEVANVGGMRIGVGPVRDMGKYGEDNILCHDVSFLNMTNDELWISKSDFMLTMPSGKTVEPSYAPGFNHLNLTFEHGQTNSGVLCFEAEAEPGAYTVNFAPRPLHATLAAWKSGMGG
ncbi:hypothetical protein CKJ80_10215 [Corynebacterium hadale]|uniref:DUF4352 domain-containing protein n=1 Tax=Corynebacterium hadale TaxID=2026255 RepID=A0AB36RJ39_9CORY|nr:hypothetical protein [Corynebacterium hadale]PAT09624.1 hypothetical protein CKJ80_10215 [Corynebacterium hadale]